jgi:asparagine synthase (glutamine-hydrolysing)
MCGICGLVAPSGEPDPALVDSMRARLRHRGPDQASTDRYGRCVLGHQRLIVLDPATGEQPVSNESGEVVAVFNGELYNFPELREEMARRGHDVRGTGDSPVIPHLYEEYGLGFVDHLAGMFAIALWDARRERLVLARDRLGKKPLLFTWAHGRTLAFASELKALLELPGVGREVDLGALDAYLALGYVPTGERHPIEGIRKVPPGHLLVYESGDFRLERYWAPEPQLAERSDEEWLELVRDTVARAVRRRLVADVPLGALLSGGIDSSVVVAEMAKASSEPVLTFTIGFGDPRYDEREHARAVSERYGTRHEEVVVDSDVLELLPQFAEAFDEPLGDDAALPLYVVCEYARRQVTVALTGDGGDEAFAGYERYFAHRAASRLPRPLARLSSQAVGILPAARREPRSAAFRAARFLRAAATPVASRYGGLMEVFPTAMRTELWTEEARAEIGRSRSAAELLGPASMDGVRGLQILDMSTYLPDDLLLKADIASMAHSLELRSPFLDPEVVELGLALPEHLRLSGRLGKVALRRGFADDLPRSVAARPKKGLGVPLSRWFRGELRELASDLLLDRRVHTRGWLRVEAVERLLADHVSGRADHAQRLWTLLMLELWQRQHVERERSVSALSASRS